MRFLLFYFIVVSVIWAKDVRSSMEISMQECMKARHGYAPGGTLHARKVLQKRLAKKMEATLPGSRKESIVKLREKYPHLKIEKLEFLIRNCKGYYRFKEGKRDIYVDPLTLEIVKGKR